MSTNETKWPPQHADGIRWMLGGGPDARAGFSGADQLGVSRREQETVAELFARALNERAERTPKERAALEMYEAHRDNAERLRTIAGRLPDDTPVDVVRLVDAALMACESALARADGRGL